MLCTLIYLIFKRFDSLQRESWFRLKYSLTSVQYEATFLFSNIWTIKLTYRPFLEAATTTRSWHAIFPKPCFGNGLHDYSKTNERIDLKLNILLRNMIIFIINIKLFEKDCPNNLCSSFLSIFWWQISFFLFAIKMVIFNFFHLFI